MSESRFDSTAAATIVGMIVLSAICMVLYRIGTTGGWLIDASGHHLSSLGLTIYTVPLVGLPLAVILMVVVLIRIAIRRSRAAKQAQQPS